jgi:hypothetical protein
LLRGGVKILLFERLLRLAKWVYFSLIVVDLVPKRVGEICHRLQKGI